MKEIEEENKDSKKKKKKKKEKKRSERSNVKVKSKSFLLLSCFFLSRFVSTLKCPTWC